MLGPQSQQTPEFAEDRFQFKDLPRPSAARHHQEPRVEDKSGVGRSEKMLHHSRMDEIIGEPPIAGLDVKALTELGRFKINVIKSQGPCKAVQKSLGSERLFSPLPWVSTQE